MQHVSIRPQLLDFAAAVELDQRKRVELAVQTADRELRVHLSSLHKVNVVQHFC